ncbi:glycoside hydrolase family 88/105 protein [Enterococcus asini]|uniref:glycoside hydrolase family 88/105 protein n=1 Tax=Enterococcus asini TaxID=57732 RepID=UPI00241E981F|nr:glycoside hydrolase family 88 protein [Enterococcus asini]
MYFEPMNSAIRNYGSRTETILQTLIQRFIGENPEVPYNPVIDFPESFPYDEEGWCHCFLDNKLPELLVGEKAVASTYWPCDNDREATLVLDCYGPTRVFVNDKEVFKTQPSQENRRSETHISLELNKGLNRLAFVTEKTTMGVGFRIRTDAPQWDPVYYYQKDTEFLPQLGFNYRIFHNEEDILETSEPRTKLVPTTISYEKEKTLLVKLAVPVDEHHFTYSGSGKLSFTDGQLVEPRKKTGFTKESDWLNLVYVGCNFSEDMASIQWMSSTKTDWLYCGPIDPAQEINFSFASIQKSESNESIYWQAPFEGAHIRLTRCSNLYAHWTYWMGVTLYGFLEAGHFFGKTAWEEYAFASLKQIIDHDEYGKWDKEHYHYALINTQFYWLDELDDCGSFGNFMLESLNYQSDPRIAAIAKRIADFMENKVIRQSDGAFYRKDDTMWVDDLYMSTPFLTRYWKLTGDERCLDDAAQQFLLFKKRSFMEKENLMSHIFDTKFNKANRIPWSRGNGWVLFSLSELLNELPENHEKREALVEFFNQMVAGILNYQDQDGLWHQVIDDETTYPESSCTAMFICAMSRGIRNGYLSDNQKEEAIAAVKHAWQGLITYCLDKDGNLYGVCRGSGHSFSRPYYHGLGWLLNDPHGIGIVALAGVEYEKVLNTENTY